MNRSFRAKESQMQAAMRPRLRSSSMAVKDRDEELALFLQMKNSEKEHNDLLLRDSFADAASVGSNQDNYPLFNISSSAPAPGRKTGADDFLNSENDKNDYDWLLTPPGTPLFPSLEMETQKTVMSQLGTSTTRPIALKSRLANPPPEQTGRSNLVSKQSPSSPRLTSSGGGTRRPSLSGNPGSRPSTPTGRPTVTTPSKSSRPSTATSCTSIPSIRTVATTTKTKPTVSATKTTVSVTKTTTVSATKTTVPVTKTTTVSATKTTVPVTKTTTVPAAKPTAPSRSSTPLSRSMARSSTPTSRPTVSATRSTSRASTPTRRPTTPSNVPTISAPTPSVKTSSISKPAPVAPKQVISKQPVPARGTSPTVRSRPWNPSEMPGYSHDAPPNLRTTLPERPLSATRGRPGAPSARSSSVEPASSGRPKRQSCSPSRGRSFNGISHTSGSSMPAVSRGYFKGNDSPGVMGTKMVERVINMRKLVPPRLDGKSSLHNNLSSKSSSSPDSSGFGRTLSKKSLDMAIRHMDIRQRVPANLRPLMTNIPASSMYSVRSGYQHSRTISISGSPQATSSNASSEMSVNQNGICLDNSEIDDDIVSERGVHSLASVRGR